MSGWDEGNVFFSEAYGADEAETKDSRTTTMRKLREFIKNFSRPGPSGSNFTYPYRESLQKSRKTLTVDIEDITAHDPQLARAFREAPGEHLPLLEAAAAEVMLTLKTKPVGEEGEADAPQRREVQVLITSQENPISPRQLTADHISKMVKVPGIIIASSKVKAKATQLSLICKNCKTPKTVQIRAGFNGAQIPRTCDHQAQVGEEACPLDPFVVVPDRSKYVDQQTLKLQEKPEDVPVGEMPRALLLSVDRHLVHLATPGKRVSVVGIFDIFGGNKEGKNKNAVAIRQPYLRVVGLTIEDAASGSEVTFTGEEEAEFKDFASQPNLYQRVSAQVAPSIFGHEDIKKAVLCLLFGGSPKHLPDRTRLRGDINVLLLGDPSTAKSQFLKFVEKTAPICVYTSGKGSSAAGLTASVIKDSSGEFYLEGGAMVLADGGVVCIDEFDKMRPEDRVAIHEAMEQQTISIAKAGITTVLNSRTAVLAAANPPSGRYDDLKTAQENIELQTTILSRFDLIFIVKDERNHEKDMQIAQHVVRIHATAENAAEDEETKQRQSFLKRFVQYCRSRCSPRLSQAAAEHLKNSYVEIRQKMKERAQETGEAMAVPITVRQLEAVIRISEARAKMELSPIATERHVEEALRLFKVSTIEAASSGVTDNIHVRPEMRAELQQIEGYIKRKVGINVRMSERRLIDSLVTMGCNESNVRRALLVMVQRGEFEYRQERKVVHRKA